MTTSPEETALHEVCGGLELKASDARCLHRHATVVYLLPSEDVVARLVRGAVEATRTETAVHVTRWLVDQDFPATAPLDVPQPAVAGEWTVTFWRHYPQGRRDRPGAGQLGRLLRELHELPAPPIAVPSYVPLTHLGQRLMDAERLPESDRRWLQARRDELLDDYHHASFPLSVGFIHGDAYPGNLLWDGERVILGDWGEVSYGPRELDLINTFQGTRFGRSEQELAAFTAAYGYDIATSPYFETLRGMRDLHTLGSYIERAEGGDQRAAAELVHRIGTLRRGDRQARWWIS